MNTNISLTTHETTVLVSIRDRGQGLSFFDQGWDVDSNSWMDVLTGELVQVLGISAQAVGGVLSSMIQKGLFSSDGEAVYLTEAALTAI